MVDYLSLMHLILMGTPSAVVEVSLKYMPCQQQEGMGNHRLLQITRRILCKQAIAVVLNLWVTTPWGRKQPFHGSGRSDIYNPHTIHDRGNISVMK